jgi:hypothetical protein
MKYLARICMIFLTVTACHAGNAATHFKLAQTQAPKECVMNCDTINFSCSQSCGLSGACVAQCNATAAACKAACPSAK